MSVGEALHVMDKTTHDEEVQGWDGSIYHAQQMARIAASRIHFRGADFEELAEEALSGVMMRLAEKPESSTRECIEAGVTAVGYFTYMLMRGHRTDGTHTGERKAMYWMDRRVHVDNYRLDELALSQVWEAMSEDTRKTLTLAALHDTLIVAAQHAGVNPNTMRKKVRKARLRALTLWHDWEQPPRLSMSSRKRLKTHCNKGHEFTAGNTQWITGARGNRQRRCATCNREAQRRHREKKAA